MKEGEWWKVTRFHGCRQWQEPSFHWETILLPCCFHSNTRLELDPALAFSCAQNVHLDSPLWNWFLNAGYLRTKTVLWLDAVQGRRFAYFSLTSNVHAHYLLNLITSPKCRQWFKSKSLNCNFDSFIFFLIFNFDSFLNYSIWCS